MGEKSEFCRGSMNRPREGSITCHTPMCSAKLVKGSNNSILPNYELVCALFYVVVGRADDSKIGLRNDLITADTNFLIRLSGVRAVVRDSTLVVARRVLTLDSSSGTSRRTEDCCLLSVSSSK
jgi:hypothetical protein